MSPRVLAILGTVAALLGALGVAAWLLLPRYCPLLVIDHSPFHGLVFDACASGHADAQAHLRDRVAAAPAIHPALEQALTGPDAALRHLAAGALSGCEGSGALPMVVRLLRAEDWVVRSAAVGRLPGTASDPVPLLIAAADDVEPAVRWHAILLLGLSLPAGMERVRQAVSDADAEVAILATSLLIGSKEPYPSGPLDRGLADPSADVRKAAVAAISDSRDPAHVERLAPLVDDAEATVRMKVVGALGAICDEQAMAIVATCMDDLDGRVRAVAGNILLHGRRTQAIPVLVDVAERHADAGARHDASVLLGHLRAISEPAATKPHQAVP